MEPIDYENVVEPTVYETERNENIRLRIQKMQELNLQPTVQQLNSMQEAKRNKKVDVLIGRASCKHHAYMRLGYLA
jgi:hypothetical protein